MTYWRAREGQYLPHNDPSHPQYIRTWHNVTNFADREDAIRFARGYRKGAPGRHTRIIHRGNRYYVEGQY